MGGCKQEKWSERVRESKKRKEIEMKNSGTRREEGRVEDETGGNENKK